MRIVKFIKVNMRPRRTISDRPEDKRCFVSGGCQSSELAGKFVVSMHTRALYNCLVIIARFTNIIAHNTGIFRLFLQSITICPTTQHVSLITSFHF